MTERAFVLRPLAEIAPEACFPMARPRKKNGEFAENGNNLGRPRSSKTIRRVPFPLSESRKAADVILRSGGFFQR